MSGIVNQTGAVSGVVDKKVEGWTLLAGVIAAATSGSVAFDGFFSSDYDIYKIFVYNCYNANDDTGIYVKFRNTNGDAEANAYRHLLEGMFGNSTTFSTSTVRGWTDDQFRMNYTGIENNLSWPIDTEWTLIDPLTPGKYKQIRHEGVQSSSNQDAIGYVHGAAVYQNTDSPIYGMSFHSSGGNISAKILIYGLSKFK